jgi:hypothetical protein
VDDFFQQGVFVQQRLNLLEVALHIFRCNDVLGRCQSSRIPLETRAIVKKMTCGCAANLAEFGGETGARRGNVTRIA